MKKHRLFCGVLSALLLLIAARVDAGTIKIWDSTVDASDPTVGRWTVSWTDSRVDVTDTTPGQDETHPIQTTRLQKVARFNATKGLAPIVLTFTEDNVSDANVGGKVGGADGLNFRLFNIIFNDTGLAWTAFGETLADQDQILEAGDLFPAPPPSTGSNAHPAIAHFHTPVNITVNPAPWSVAGSPNATNQLLLTQPPNELGGNSGELDFDVKIHDILADSYKRSFTLTETPSVPEPASLTLFGLGAAAMMGYAWRRRKNGASAVR